MRKPFLLTAAAAIALGIGPAMAETVTIATVMSVCEPFRPIARPALSRTTMPRHDIQRYVPSLCRRR